MKNILLGLMLLILTLDAFAQTISSSPQKICIKDLVGRWETADGAGLEIIDSSRIFVTYGSERKPILSYQVDFSNHHAGLIL